MGLSEIVSDLDGDIVELLAEVGEQLTYTCVKTERNPDNTVIPTSTTATVTGYLGTSPVSSDGEGTESEGATVYIRGADLTMPPEIGDTVTQLADGSVWRVTAVNAIPNQANVAAWKLEVER